MLTHVVDTCRALNKDEAYALMSSADLGLKESTLRRRSSTVAAWSQWVAELLEMGQLRIPS